MIVEVNNQGASHVDYAPRFSSKTCNEKDFSERHGYCLNCGWRPSHVQETGAEVVVHFEKELTELTWPSN